MKEFKIMLLESLRDAIITVGLFCLITALWRLCECEMYGVPKPSSEDTIISVILTVLLLFNIRNLIDEKTQQKPEGCADKEVME